MLLLVELSRGNANIQKIIAFESAFERLLEIIYYEQAQGVVSEDCLVVLLHLLKNNSHNQQLFRENSLIQRLAPLLQLATGSAKHPEELELHDGGKGDEEDVEEDWSDQKCAIVHAMLQILRTLVAPSNSENLSQRRRPCVVSVVSGIH